MTKEKQNRIKKSLNAALSKNQKDIDIAKALFEKSSRKAKSQEEQLLLLRQGHSGTDITKNNLVNAKVMATSMSYDNLLMKNIELCEYRLKEILAEKRERHTRLKRLLIKDLTINKKLNQLISKEISDIKKSDEEEQLDGYLSKKQ